MRRGGRMLKKRQLVSLLAVLLSAVFLLGACGKGPEAAPAGAPAGESAGTTETAAPAPQPVSRTGQVLDKAFAAGKVVFTQAEIPQPDLQNWEIIIPPDGAWDESPERRITADDLRPQLGEAAMTLFSYSPDGSTWIGWFDDNPVAVSEGRIAFLYPAKDRGAGYQHEILKQHYSQTFMQSKNAFGTDTGGITWSPDGRYFCVINHNRISMQNLTQYGSPLIADTRTGEVFCIDTFNPLRSHDNTNYTTWITGCFSTDGRYFYAVCYGTQLGSTIIRRYDLESGATADFGYPMNSADDYYAYPAPAVQKDGTVTLLISDKAKARNQSILQIDANGASRRQRLTAFDDEELMTITTARRLIGSGESGEALVLYEEGGNAAGSPILFRSAISHIRMDDLSRDPDTVWVAKTNPLRLEAVVPSSLKGNTPDEEELNRAAFENMDILDAVLSPDGRYAAVLAGNRHLKPNEGQVAMMMVRLEDMAMVPAEAPLLNQLTYRDVSMYINRHTHLLNWSEAGLLAVPAGMLFRVQAE